MNVADWAADRAAASIRISCDERRTSCVEIVFERRDMTKIASKNVWHKPAEAPATGLDAHIVEEGD